MTQGLDWPGLLQVGLGVLKLHPDQFWALTPLELKLMLGDQRAPSAMGRTGLLNLMAQYPDAAPGRDRPQSDLPSQNSCRRTKGKPDGGY